MEGRRKKAKPTPPADPVHAEQNEFRELIAAVDCELQYRAEHNEDVIEAYFNARCHRWLQDAKKTCDRIESGYIALLKELEK